MIFFIFLSVLQNLNFSQQVFSRVTFIAHFNSFFSNIGWFNRKTKNTVRFSTIKIRLSIFFMHLRSKPISEIHPKVGSLDGKKAKLFQSANFDTFFQKTLYLLKYENHQHSIAIELSLIHRFFSGVNWEFCCCKKAEDLEILPSLGHLI